MRGHKLIFVFLVALFLRFGFFIFALLNNGPLFGIKHSADTYGYDLLAVNLIEGNGFSIHQNPPFLPDTNRTPIYPFFLAFIYWLFGYKPYIVLCLQSIIGAFTCVLVLLLERQIFGERSACISGWILAFYPLSIVYNNSLLTESLFTFLLVISVLYFARLLEFPQLSYACLCGLLLGLATLCRPAGIFVIYLLVAFLIILKFIHVIQIKWQRLLLISVCLCVGFTVVIFPWILRNQSITGVWQISSIHGSSAAWILPVAYTRALRTGRLPSEEFVALTKEYMEIADRSGFFSPERRRFWSQSIREILDAHPPYWQLQTWGMILTSFSPQTYYTGSLLGIEGIVHINMRKNFATAGLWKTLVLFYEKKSTRELIYSSIFICFSLFLYFLVLRCLFEYYKSPVVVVLFLLIFFLLLTPSPSGDARYRIPAMPFIMVLGSCGFHSLFKTRFKFAYH